MELERIRRILELPGGAAFAVSEGAVVCATAEAEALGLLPGVSVDRLLPASILPEAGETVQEVPISLAGANWRLRAAAEEGCLLCFLRPEAIQSPAPNENTLLRTAGSIRLALHEVTVALEALTDAAPKEMAAEAAAITDPTQKDEAPKETASADPAAAEAAAAGPASSGEAARSGGLALRGVYRMRRAVEALELYARLRGGSYRPACREISVTAAVSALLGELTELLRAADLELRWELPPRDLVFRLDWPLLNFLLQELICNAAANNADGMIRVKLTRTGEDRLRFAVSNRPAEPLPEALFHLHAAPQQALQSGMGLGLSLVSAGAACHGGSLLLSTDRDGTVTALLSVAAGHGPDAANRCFIQLPTGAEATLIALSPVLPPELYRPEDLL